MAPNEDVALQTEQIIEFLFNLEGGSSYSCLECDSPDPFDAAAIAEKLRNVADSFNDDVRFKAALDELKEAAANEAVEAAFGRGVDVLCQSHVAQMPEVAPEMQLIRVSVAFGLFVKQSCPELKMKTQRAMISFLNRRVSSWVAQKGGWNKVM